MEFVTKVRGRLAVVQHHVTCEAVAGRLLELAQPAEFRRGDGGGYLDFHAGDVVWASVVPPR